MKNYAPLIVAAACVFSLNVSAQRNDRSNGPSKMGMSELYARHEGEPIVSYRVVEKINMNFGSRVTTYTVPTLDLVSTINLGPNNSRVITPVYGKSKPKRKTQAVALENRTIASSNTIAVFKPSPQTIAALPTLASVDPVVKRRNSVGSATSVKSVSAPVTNTAIAPAATEKAPEKKESMTVKIDLISTYERVLEKGYRSVDMLKKVSNARFFDGDLIKAEKWYSELFKMTDDLEAAFYYRYAQSLKAVNQNDKAKQMMALFEKKDL